MARKKTAAAPTAVHPEHRSAAAAGAHAATLLQESKDPAAFLKAFSEALSASDLSAFLLNLGSTPAACRAVLAGRKDR